jgi:uncharacterized membrane protein
MNSLSFLFVLYGIGVLIFSAFSWAGIYHLFRFGYKGDISKSVVFIYAIISMAVIVLTIVALSVIYKEANG